MHVHALKVINRQKNHVLLFILLPCWFIFLLGFMLAILLLPFLPCLPESDSYATLRVRPRLTVMLWYCLQEEVRIYNLFICCYLLIVIKL